jgi:Sulfotransferase family
MHGKYIAVAMIIAEKNLIFVHIQKTGGMAVSRALGGVDHPAEKHRTALELRDLYGADVWDQSYKFAFVRNPWDRLVSWWSMINARRDEFGSIGDANSFMRYVLENAMTFDAFLTKCTDTIDDIDGVKHIFQNQLDYLSDEDGQEIVDFIGRFETLADDFATISAKVYGKPIALAHINASNHAPFQTYYTPQTRKLVEKAYARDIARFGYCFD